MAPCLRPATTLRPNVATATTAVLVAGSMALRVLNPFAAPAPDPSDWVPHLWGLGALVVVALTHTWAPTIAWVALVIGSAASGLGAVGPERSFQALGPAGQAVCATLMLMGRIEFIAVLALLAVRR